MHKRWMWKTIEGEEMKEDFCPQCNHIVEKNDVNKEKWGTNVFHGGCRQKLQERAALRNETVVLIWRGNESKLAFMSTR